jgi:3D-(3,5/4)-trihydroxycyclohexane-1,2-dione acylhydrolase (decyclizing)
VDRLYTHENPEGLSQIRCLGELNEDVLPEDAVIVGASGSLPGDLQRVWRCKSQDSYHMEYGFSCMGYEIAAALGVKLASPEREVFALVGDGSYVMLHSELLTSIQEGIKINIIVFDNHGFQCIDNLQVSQGIEKFGNEWRMRETGTRLLTGEYLSLDFSGNGESYGARGFSVHNLEQFRDAIKLALEETRSTVIDVKVTPKSMTGSYDSWWRVGVPEVSLSRRVIEASQRHNSEVRKAKQF